MKNAKNFAKSLLLAALASFYATGFAAQTSVSAPQTPSDAAVSSTQVLPNSSETQINPSIKTLLEWAKEDGEETLCEVLALATMPAPKEYATEHSRKLFSDAQDSLRYVLAANLDHHMVTEMPNASHLSKYLRYDNKQAEHVLYDLKTPHNIDIFKDALLTIDSKSPEKINAHMLRIKNNNVDPANLAELQKYLFQKTAATYTLRATEDKNLERTDKAAGLLKLALTGPENYDFLNPENTAQAIRNALNLPEAEPITLENLANHADEIVNAASNNPSMLKRLNTARPALEKYPVLQNLFDKLPKNPEDATQRAQPNASPAGKSSKLIWALVITGTIATSVSAVVIAEKLLFKYRPGWWKKIKNKLLGTKEIWVKE